MIAPETYASLGELLRDALVQWKTETALIEANRKQETARFSYLEVKRIAERLARVLEDAGVGADSRVAICMSNQARWPISGTAVFLRGGVLVPIDYKLTAGEQETLLAHCKPTVVITEWPTYRDWSDRPAPLVIVAEAPKSAELPEGVVRWEDLPTDRAPYTFVPRSRGDQATLVYSSGTGGRPKGCMLSHDNYLEQYRSLAAVFPLNVGDRYFSILPTNHAIDFMCGFLGPFAGGATVVHQRSLRPEFINDSMERFEITHMSIVPLILEAFERRIVEKLEAKSDLVQHVFEGLRQLNAALTVKGPKTELSRRLLKPVHDAFGGHLRYVFCGGAFVDRARAQYFYDLGLPVVIGYGLTEAGTVLTVNDLKPFRADSVGAPLDGVELQIRDADDEGVGEVWAKSRTVMLGYLGEPELTAEAIVDGFLRTGDRGYLDGSGHLHLVGRSKNMIVTAGGKNVHPEDVESAFEGLDVEELVLASSGYLFPGGKITDEMLVLVVRDPKPGVDVVAEVDARNQKLADFKRVRGVLTWNGEFPRTASMKIKRDVLAAEIRASLDRRAITKVRDS